MLGSSESHGGIAYLRGNREREVRSTRRFSVFSFSPLGRSAWGTIGLRPANQRSEQQGMVLVHMGTRPARARLICMARAPAGQSKVWRLHSCVPGNCCQDTAEYRERVIAVWTASTHSFFSACVPHTSSITIHAAQQ
ncbi:hypothetical protein EYF80_023322 [Liparis tanakae]|uniref:Uncharacterized protein n=1 Tax=Liparis tanakae TaxID=230148 RepID=A0A4Z2HMB5_9TELE|nr:hypothetical protein EYF80_023322 [Liparis tanakae]